MAQPYPPAGGQQQYNERPLKVYGEQYHVGMDPLPVGATTETQNPMYADGRPHVIATTGVYDLAEGDWVISSRYSGHPVEVISNEEFDERFGKGNLAEGKPGE